MSTTIQQQLPPPQQPQHVTHLNWEVSTTILQLLEIMGKDENKLLFVLQTYNPKTYMYLKNFKSFMGGYALYSVQW